MPEIWREAVGYENLYRISNLGNLQDILTGKIRKSSLNSRGYPQLHLWRNGKKRNHTIHSLVMASFVGDRPTMMDINHRNGNKTDNRIENLEYVTRSQNIKHAFSIGLISKQGEKNPRAKLTDALIFSIRQLRKEGMTGRMLSRKFGISDGHVSDIVHHRLWAHV